MDAQPDPAPNTFRQGALPADPSARQRIGAMLGEQDYARFRELRETAERLREQLASESGLAPAPAPAIRDQCLFDTGGAEPPPLNHFRIWPGPLANIFGERTRAQIARRAAVNLAALAPMGWRVNARGGGALDDLGFVRICVQAALDWNPVTLRPAWVDPIADAFLPAAAGSNRRHNPNDLARLCQDWGLQKVDLKGRRAGDVILYPISAHGAACGILIDRREPTQGPDRVALMAKGKIPEIHARSGFDQIPCAAFTWPEEA